MSFCMIRLGEILQLVWWVLVLTYFLLCRFRVFLKSVGGLLSSLLYSCFLDDMTPLSLPLKFLRFLHLCGRCVCVYLCLSVCVCVCVCAHVPLIHYWVTIYYLQTVSGGMCDFTIIIS